MRKKIKILLGVEGLYFGGLEKVVCDIARELNFRDYQVHLAGRKPELYTDHLPKDVTTHRIDGRNIVTRWRSLKNIVDEVKPDIIHSHYAPFMPIVSRLNGVPSIETIHNVYGDFLGWKGKTLFGLSSLFVDRMTAVSDAAAQSVRKGIPFCGNAKIRTINNFIDSERSINRCDSDRKETSRVTVAYVGRLSHEKRVELFIDIAKRAKDIYKDKVQFLIIGEDGLYGKILEKYAERISATNCVEFCGFLGSPFIKRKIDIFVLPSVQEGLPMTILEAGLNDAACVLSNVGGCAEIIEDCVDGFLVDPTDLDGYYDKIATLIENGELRNTMAGKLKRKVASKYSPNSIIDQYEDLYKQTIVS